MQFDRRKTLTELENSDWGPPTFDSNLVKTCHALRHKAIKEFTTEDLRIMILQKIGLAFLVPPALEVLSKDPLAEGDLYRGDLFHALMIVGPTFWCVNHEALKKARSLVSAARARVLEARDSPDPISDIEERIIEEGISTFDADTSDLDR